MPSAPVKSTLRTFGLLTGGPCIDNASRCTNGVLRPSRTRKRTKHKKRRESCRTMTRVDLDEQTRSPQPITMRRYCQFSQAYSGKHIPSPFPLQPSPFPLQPSPFPLQPSPFPLQPSPFNLHLIFPDSECSSSETIDASSARDSIGPPRARSAPNGSVRSDEPARAR